MKQANRVSKCLDFSDFRKPKGPRAALFDIYYRRKCLKSKAQTRAIALRHRFPQGV
jgi:hypothetical protein